MQKKYDIYLVAMAAIYDMNEKKEDGSFSRHKSEITNAIKESGITTLG